MNTEGRPVILLAHFRADAPLWWEGLAPAADVAELRLWPDIGAPEEVDYVVVWRQTPGFFEQFQNLKAIFSTGAGVETLLAAPDLPDVPLVRMVDDSLRLGITEYVVERVLHHHRRMPVYRAQQQERTWRQYDPLLARERSVLVLGMGAIGEHCAKALALLGFRVRGWSRSGRAVEGVESVTGPLPPHLADVDYLVGILPLTEETRGVLNRDLFAGLTDTYLINVGRGGHLLEEDLIPALDAGQLNGAALDVFQTEPLPAEHPFWSDPRITVTPHDAAVTVPRMAAGKIVDNLRRLLADEAPIGLVDRARGY
jgi:glyoxylate/hydroxypyruvate reductase A